MYTTYTADDYRQYIDLPSGYTVSGLLAYGVWDLQAEGKQVPILKTTLEKFGYAYKLLRFDKPIIGHAYELTVDDRHYWFVPVMGTAVMSSYLHVACSLGSKKNILLGVVGGLARGMKTADFVIPTIVHGNDNARVYDRQNEDGLYSPDLELQQRLRAKLGVERKIWDGKTTTCEIVLGETFEDITSWTNEGYIGVEMEAALFYSASRNFHVPALRSCSSVITLSKMNHS